MCYGIDLEFFPIDSEFFPELAFLPQNFFKIRIIPTDFIAVFSLVHPSNKGFRMQVAHIAKSIIVGDNCQQPFDSEHGIRFRVPNRDNFCLSISSSCRALHVRYSCSAFHRGFILSSNPPAGIFRLLFFQNFCGLTQPLASWLGSGQISSRWRCNYINLRLGCAREMHKRAQPLNTEKTIKIN